MKKVCVLMLLMLLFSCSKGKEYDYSGVSKITDGQQVILDAKIEIVQDDEEDVGSGEIIIGE